ncbi:MAG TPA: GntR family transcriptional regulator [Acidimicrobiales bacterium]|nr:GntR family transcriptional regulator [Acidimicrobiales bacterium]
MQTPAGTGSVSIAYDRIRRSIVEGSYPAGSRLVEQALSAELALSRTPIREALRRLEVEGLVLYRRNRGAVVRATTPEEVADLYELRARLEGYAAELAAVRSTADDRQALVDAADAFDALVGAEPAGRRRTAGHRWALHEANGRFHRAIVTAAGHERLLQMLDRTVDVPLVYQALERFDPAELERSALFHRMITQAVGTGEAARAGRLMAEHILLGRDRLLDPSPISVMR